MKQWIYSLFYCLGAICLLLFAWKLIKLFLYIGLIFLVVALLLSKLKK